MILISLWNNKTKTQEKHQMTKLKTSKRNNTIIVHTTISLSASRSTIGSIKYLQITWKNGCYAEFSSLLLLGGVWSSLLSKANNGSDESTVVLHPFVGTSSWLLLLVLFSNLWCLASHLTGTSQGSMNLTHGESDKRLLLFRMFGDRLVGFVRCSELRYGKNGFREEAI